MNKQEIESYVNAGEIAKQIVEYSKTIIKPNILLVEIARKIHKKIESLGAIAAFPVNLSIDDIAAHYHPTNEDQTVASGLLKVDLGIAVDGYIADTAFTLDLTPNNKHKELIQANELALNNVIEKLKKDTKISLNEIGKTIQETIEKKGFSPIVNLSGHGLERYEIHAPPTIPNYANNNENNLKDGAYATEPFATTGEGRIYEGPSGNILAIINPKNTRNPLARKILDYAYDKYETLPFSLREIEEKFGKMSKLAVNQMVKEEILHEFSQLIEKSHHPVSQAEHTFIISNNEVIITTKE
jgi:methionyl aminopeptidase